MLLYICIILREFQRCTSLKLHSFYITYYSTHHPSTQATFTQEYPDVYKAT